jgi:hypothetical protein
LAIGEWIVGLLIGFSHQSTIQIDNRQLAIQSGFDNPVFNPQLPIVDSIGSLQSAIGNR